MHRSLLSLLVIGAATVCLTAGGCPLLEETDVAGDSNLAPLCSDAAVSGVLVSGQLCNISVGCLASDEDGSVQVVEADLSAIGGDSKQALALQTQGWWGWAGDVTPPASGTHTITFLITDDEGAAATVTYEVVVNAPADGAGGDDGIDDGDGGTGGDGDGGGDAPNQAPVFGSVLLSPPLVDIDDQEVTITCNVSDPDGSVAWVTVDLSELNYASILHMNKVTEGQWTLTYPVAPWTTGTKTLPFRACDDDGAEVTYSTTVQVQRHPITILRDFAPGYLHALALRDDGTMMAWGQPDSALYVPQPGRFLKVAVAGYGIAIREDQTLVGWGPDEYGETIVPAGTFKAIAAASSFAVGIRTDGSLQAWGRDHLNFLNVPAGNDFVQVDALFGSAIARHEDGRVVVWGPSADPFMLGETIDIPDVTGAPADGGYVDVAAGGYHCLAVKADGTLIAWGDNANGQCDVPVGTYQAVDAGYLVSAALRTDGEVSEVPAGNDFVDVWCGMYYGVAKRADGSLVYWGADTLAPIPDELQ
jgi:alpha-tubulin suppressor-like RCC1 family protein